jgi:hypothetical protein
MSARRWVAKGRPIGPTPCSFLPVFDDTNETNQNRDTGERKDSDIKQKLN